MQRTIIVLLGTTLLLGCQSKDGGDATTGTAAASTDLDGDGYATAEGDCDDASAAVHPAATETCNGLDDDCDGLVDEADPDLAPPTWYADRDGDGHGDPEDALAACQAPEGYVEAGDDCNDADPAVHPGSAEVCDPADVDEDCDGGADDLDPEGSPSTALYHADADGDGFGDQADPGTPYCDPPAGVVPDDTDCDDTRAGVHPGATEVCDPDDIDEDCDGMADDDDPDGVAGTMDYYPDVDGDLLGDRDATPLRSCEAPAGMVTNSMDCDDTDASVPGSELDDGIDNDCDDMVDEGYRRAGDVLITEVMFDPAGDASTKRQAQWIEVFNPGAEDLHADGLVFTTDGACPDVLSVAGSFAIAPGSLVIPAGGYAVLCHGGSLAGGILGRCDYVYGQDVDNTTMDNGPSLVGLTSDANWCLAVDAPTTIEVSLGGTVLDAVTYEVGTGGWPAGSEGASFVLDAAAYDAAENDDGENWCYPDASEVYDDRGTADATDDLHGSPGEAGTCSATPP